MSPMRQPANRMDGRPSQIDSEAPTPKPDDSSTPQPKRQLYATAERALTDAMEQASPIMSTTADLAAAVNTAANEPVNRAVIDIDATTDPIETIADQVNGAQQCRTLTNRTTHRARRQHTQ